MVTITCQLKLKMATKIEVVYELSTVVKANTEKARCRLLESTYHMAKIHGINANACFHGFVVA